MGISSLILDIDVLSTWRSYCWMNLTENAIEDAHAAANRWTGMHSAPKLAFKVFPPYFRLPTCNFFRNSVYHTQTTFSLCDSGVQLTFHKPKNN